MSFLPISHERSGDASIFRTSWAGVDASAAGTSITQTQEYAAMKTRIQSYMDRLDAVDPSTSGIPTIDEYNNLPGIKISKEAAGSMFQDQDGWYKIIRINGFMLDNEYTRLYWFDSLEIAKRYRGMWQANCVGIRTYHDDDEYREAEFLGPKSALEELRRFCETASEPCEVKVSSIVDSSAGVSNGKWPSFSVGISAIDMLKRDDLSKLKSGAPSHNTMTDGIGRGWWQMSMIRNCWAALIDDYEAGISEVWISTAPECPPGMTPWFCNEDSSGNFIPVKRRLIGRYVAMHDWDSIGGDPNTMKSYADQTTGINWSNQARRYCPDDGSLYTAAMAVDAGYTYAQYMTWQVSGDAAKVIYQTPMLCCRGARKWSKQWNVRSRYGRYPHPIFSCNFSVWEYTVLGALFTAYFGTQKHYQVMDAANIYQFGGTSQSDASWIIASSSDFQYYNSSETLTGISTDWAAMKPSGLADAVASQHVISRGGLGVLYGDSFPGIGTVPEYMETRNNQVIVNSLGMFLYIENPSCSTEWLTGARSWKKYFNAYTVNGIDLPNDLPSSNWYSDMTTMTISSNRSNGLNKWFGLELLPIKNDNPLAQYQTDTSIIYEYRKRETLNDVDETAMMNVYFLRTQYPVSGSYLAAHSFNSARMPLYITKKTNEPGTGSNDADSTENHKEVTFCCNAHLYNQSYREMLYIPYTAQIVNNYRSYENAVFSVGFQYNTNSTGMHGYRPVVDVTEDDRILPYVYVPKAAYSTVFDLTFDPADVIIDIKFAIENHTTNQMLLEYSGGWNNSASSIFRWVLYNYYASGTNTVRSDLKNSSNSNCDVTIYSPCDSKVPHEVRIESYNGTLSAWHDGVAGGSAACVPASNSKAYSLFAKSSNYYFGGWLYYVKIRKHDGTLLYDLRPYKHESGQIGLARFDENGKYQQLLRDGSHPLYEEKP